MKCLSSTPRWLIAVYTAHSRRHFGVNCSFQTHDPGVQVFQERWADGPRPVSSKGRLQAAPRTVLAPLSQGEITHFHSSKGSSLPSIGQRPAPRLGHAHIRHFQEAGGLTEQGGEGPRV